MKVTTNGISIYVEEQGRGDLALIFLHYWGGSSHTWKYVTAALAKSYRTIAIDHRGWGESDAPAVGYSLADHAEDILGVINALGLKRYLLVGHSMSGKIAQLIASRRPPGLIGLVLVASALPGPLEFPREMLESMVHLYDTRQAIEGAIDQALVAKPLNQADREQVIADSLRGAQQAKAAWPQSSGLEDIRALVELIDVPTLAVYGGSDHIHTMESIKSELVSRIPGTVLEILPGIGHLPPLESPTELVQLIERFVAGSLDEHPSRTFFH